VEQCFTNGHFTDDRRELKISTFSRHVLRELEVDEILRNWSVHEPHQEIPSALCSEKSDHIQVDFVRRRRGQLECVFVICRGGAGPCPVGGGSGSEAVVAFQLFFYVQLLIVNSQSITIIR
jgi:hypothetical protein